MGVEIGVGIEVIILGVVRGIEEGREVDGVGVVHGGCVGGVSRDGVCEGVQWPVVQ